MTDTSWLKKTHIAHRGLHDDSRPENSMAAFVAALTHGFAIECDVQASLEGIPVVFHDAHLARMTGEDAFVYQRELQTLKTYTLADSTETIASLEDVLQFVDGRVPLLIEIKADSPVVSLTNAVITLLKDYSGEVAIHSFSPAIVRHLKKKAPAILRGQISSQFANNTHLSSFKKFYLSRMLLNPWTQPDFVTYDISALPNPTVDRFKKSKKPIIGYTAKTQADYTNALTRVDNVVFEGFLPEV